MKQNISKDDVLNTLRHELPRLQAEYGVEKIAIYGSFAKGSPSPKSDVDILVQLSRPLGFGFIRLATQLEKSLGRRVDLTTFESLKTSVSSQRRAAMVAEIEKTLIYA